MWPDYMGKMTWINKGAHGDGSTPELWTGKRRQNPVQTHRRRESGLVAPLETIQRVSQQVGITVMSLGRNFLFLLQPGRRKVAFPVHVVWVELIPSHFTYDLVHAPKFIKSRYVHLTATSTDLFGDSSYPSHTTWPCLTLYILTLKMEAEKLIWNVGIHL